MARRGRKLFGACWPVGKASGRDLAFPRAAQEAQVKGRLQATGTPRGSISVWQARAPSESWASFLNPQHLLSGEISALPALGSPGQAVP